MIYMIWGYGMCINIFALYLRGKDKRIARKNGAMLEHAGIHGHHGILTKKRVSENMLLIVSALGGRVGGYIAMIYFRHKTIKGSFLWKFWGIVIIWLVVLGWILFM